MKKAPSYYKQKWFDHYERIAKAKGLVFTKRQFKRVEHGFCMNEWLKDNNKDKSINSLFQWHYTDAIQSLVSQPSRLLGLLAPEPTPRVMSLNKTPPQRKSHAQLWRCK